jgi:hypothetical protein
MIYAKCFIIYQLNNLNTALNIILFFWAFRLASSPSGFPLIVLGKLASSHACGLSATIPNAG